MTITSLCNRLLSAVYATCTLLHSSPQSKDSQRTHCRFWCVDVQTMPDEVTGTGQARQQNVTKDSSVKGRCQDAEHGSRNSTFPHLTRHSVAELAAKACHERRLHNSKLVCAQSDHRTDKACKPRPHCVVLHEIDTIKA